MICWRHAPRERAQQARRMRLSRSGGFSPLQLPALVKWLSWAGATDTGTLSVPDVLGGSPATQSTGALKPTVGSADNGVRIGTFSAHFLSLPLSAAINDATKFGVAFWLNAADVSGIKVILSINNFAGGANANKLLVNTFGASFEVRAQNVDRHAQVASLDAGLWRFCYAGIDCSKGTEATQVVMSLDGVPGTVIFNSDTAWPASLPTPTGNMIIGGNSLAPSSPFVGSVGDIYFFLDQLSTVDQVRLSQFNPPRVVPLVGNVVALGNSITAGGGLTPTQNYPYLVGASLGHGWQVFNCGHASWTTTQLIGNFAEVQSHFAPRTTNNILIVNEISNEVDQGVSEATAKQNMRTLIAMGRANGWRVLFATTTPRGAPATWSPAQQLAVDNINTFFKNNPSESDGVIDWAADPSLDDATDATYYQDGVHPTAAGAAIMASLVLDAIT